MGPELRMTQKSLSTTKNLGMDDGGKQELRLGCREVKPAMDLLDHWVGNKEATDIFTRCSFMGNESSRLKDECGHGHRHHSF